jgi:hypothetical protein
LKTGFEIYEEVAEDVTDNEDKHNKFKPKLFTEQEIEVIKEKLQWIMCCEDDQHIILDEIKNLIQYIKELENIVIYRGSDNYKQ